MLIINGKILTMEGPAIACGYVRTKGRLIDEVGTMQELSQMQNEKI